jgi:2,2-dialkylglycine decarboxylase (pyruvate)
VAMYMAKIASGGYEIIGIQRSFHGMTASARGATYSYGTKRHGPGMPGNHMLPAPYAYRCPVRHCNGRCDCTCLDVGFEAFDAASEGYGAAVMVEPILSAGGLIDPPAEWFQELARRTRQRGMFLILDEAQTAPGRLGAMFGFEQLGIVPDFLVISKCIGGGIPLSAVATSSEIEQRCFDEGFVMGSSHTNDPLPARVGLAVLQVLVDEDLPARAARQGARLRAALDALAEKYELIGDIRGRGLLQGFELVADRDTKRPAEQAGAVFARACLDRGLIANIVRMRGEMSICRLAPPLTITDDELDRGIAIMDEALAVATEALNRPAAAAG